MKALFIDRDGVINKDPGGWTKYSYVTEPKDLHFLPGSLDALRLLRDSGIGVIVVSNQAGVSKGYFTEGRLNEINDRMLKEISSHGGNVIAVYYCIHKDEDRCSCRKPGTGLFEMAARKYDIDFNDTYIIGDAKGDIEAGRRLGMKTIFVLSGKTPEGEMKKWKDKPDYVFRDLLGAVTWLLDKEKRREDRARRRVGDRRQK